MNILEILAAICAASNEMDEETKEKLRKEFEEEQNKKFNRGTVISAMAERNFDSFDMKRILNNVKTSEQAEAAVGLVKSGKYDSYDIERILKNL